MVFQCHQKANLAHSQMPKTSRYWHKSVWFLLTPFIYSVFSVSPKTGIFLTYYNRPSKRFCYFFQLSTISRLIIHLFSIKDFPQILVYYSYNNVHIQMYDFDVLSWQGQTQQATRFKFNTWTQTFRCLHLVFIADVQTHQSTRHSFIHRACCFHY